MRVAVKIMQSKNYFSQNIFAEKRECNAMPKFTNSRRNNYCNDKDFRSHGKGQFRAEQKTNEKGTTIYGAGLIEHLPFEGFKPHSQPRTSKNAGTQVFLVARRPQRVGSHTE